MNKKCFKEMESVIRKNMDKRGLDKLNFPGELEKASEELLKSTTVLIVTGFVIRDVLAGETDGPLGAVSLAGALEKLGKRVVLVTDSYSRKILDSCCRVKEIKGPVEVVPYENPGEFCSGLLQKYKPSHIAAIERPGKAKDGHCYSMRGEDLSDIVSDTDILFDMAKEKGITTMAVGDGGNEVGMGKAAFFVVNFVNKGEKICAAFASDYLIAAGVSNWGGHALAAALSVMANTMLLHDIMTEVKLMETMVEAGAVDGCSKKGKLTVDGLSMEENLEVLCGLRNVVEWELEEAALEAHGNSHIQF